MARTVGPSSSTLHPRPKVPLLRRLELSFRSSSLTSLLITAVAVFTFFSWIHALHRRPAFDHRAEYYSSYRASSAAATQGGEAVVDVAGSAATANNLRRRPPPSLARPKDHLTFADLTPEELRPRKGPRHMVDPPRDEPDSVVLVRCVTTAGVLHMTVHPSWAPVGAARFLDMVRSNYFSSRVALMRCVKDFICQFGIAGAPDVDKQFRHTIPDDRNWLPEGPTHRQNDEGVRRFARGYLAYAGGGKDSRSNQLIIALQSNGPLGGGSPWEVPWGELVGTESYDTLDNIYTGYGEDGPSQALLHREGSSANVADKFPKLDYITKCEEVV